ncbi:hypothetical protein CDL12_16325 [Handroanthus impetiginosus]|uniref:Rapid ALkalinization Factor n=1 Tax=Handroanthus impetiginosus TaxID=429701 RepID=A0A2G9H0N4_9LAMI|nr:hypothetical protein CDL12_16325 [Handroanthus impetiginosus]
MKKINTNEHSFLQLGVALALVLVLLTAATAAHAPVEAGSNATRIADWYLPDDEEFMVESERRILATGKNMVAYRVLDPKKSRCDRNVQSSCIGPAAKYYKDRKCDYRNLCRT